jgi:hypothetical protein
MPSSTATRSRHVSRPYAGWRVGDRLQILTISDSFRYADYVEILDSFDAEEARNMLVAFPGEYRIVRPSEGNRVVYEQ